jgi:hypothetical protein
MARLSDANSAGGTGICAVVAARNCDAVCPCHREWAIRTLPEGIVRDSPVLVDDTIASQPV